MTVETILEGIISFIGATYFLALMFVAWDDVKDLLYVTIIAFLMVLTVLLLGRFIFQVW